MYFVPTLHPNMQHSVNVTVWLLHPSSSWAMTWTVPTDRSIAVNKSVNVDCSVFQNQSIHLCCVPTIPDVLGRPLPPSPRVSVRPFSNPLHHFRTYCTPKTKCLTNPKSYSLSNHNAPICHVILQRCPATTSA